MAVEYVAYNETGERITGTLEVESLERAQEALWASNLVVLKLTKRRRLPPLAQLMPTLFGVKLLDIITFTRELASLLESGIALMPSLTVLYQETEKRALKDAIRSVTREIEIGNSFSQACAKQPTVFSPFYTRLLQVAEETGELRKILIEIVTHLERQRTIAGKIRRALTYPSIVLVMATIATFVLVTFALPALTKLLGEYGAEMPWTTQLLVSIGNLGQAYGKYLLIAVVTLVLIGWQYFRTARGKKRWDRGILKIPVINRIIHHSQMARLCSSSATLLSGGLATAETLKLSIEVSDNTVFREGLSEVYREVLTGSRLESAILKQKVFPRLFAQTVGVGEETGSLKENLRGLATFYEQETDRVTTRATELIEPTIILLVGGIVGFIGVSVVSAIYSIIPQIR